MEKIFKGVLILDWKRESMRIIKKKPQELGPFEIDLMLEIKVKIPNRETKRLSTEVEVPESKISEMVAHEI